MFSSSVFFMSVVFNLFCILQSWIITPEFQSGLICFINLHWSVNPRMVSVFACILPEKNPVLYIHSLFILFFFLGPNLQHMEVLRLGVELELQLPAYTPATATWDPSCVCALHHSSRQCQILNPLREARDQTHVLMDMSLVRYCWATTGTFHFYFL